MNYKGSCHCGLTKFEVEGEIKSVMACNCSICSRKGSLLWFVPREALRLSTPDANLKTYEFNKHTIKHRFCPECGIHPFAHATDPRSGKPMAAINVRCIENVDLDSLEVKKFNGRAL
jgi:hypothetical protein